MAALSDEQKNAVIAIAERNGGTIRPQEVVRAARNRNHPCHRLFIWDNDAAAEEFRLIQASQIIRRVRIEVTVTELKNPVRAPFFGRNVKDGGYATLDWLRRDEDAAREACILEYSKAKSAMRRAHQLAIQLKLGQESLDTIKQMCEMISANESIIPGTPLH